MFLSDQCSNPQNLTDGPSRDTATSPGAPVDRHTNRLAIPNGFEVVVLAVVGHHFACVGRSPESEATSDAFG